MFMISGTDPLPNLPRRLKELRQELGWTLEDVAERVGVTQRGVASNWEATNQRRRTPPLTTLVTLQRWYGVSLDYLVGHPGAERDSPAVKAGKKALRERLREARGVEFAPPSDRARVAVRLALEVGPDAFFVERLAACLFVTVDELKGLIESGVWADGQLQSLADLLGIDVEWFYSLQPVHALNKAK